MMVCSNDDRLNVIVVSRIANSQGRVALLRVLVKNRARMNAAHRERDNQ